MKVFQIGFNKCGTYSLYLHLNCLGIRSVHWDGGNLAKTILRNIEANRPPLDKYEEYQGYTDIENLESAGYIAIFRDYFRTLDSCYPGSKFILNIRDRNDWVRSRSAHPSYLMRYQKAIKGSEEDVVKCWEHEWDQHLLSVIDYFRGRPEALFVLDIDHPNVSGLNEFLGASTGPDTLPHKNRTVDRVHFNPV